MKKLLGSYATALFVSVGTFTIVPVATTNAVYAQGVPTVDTRNILQTIEQVKLALDDLGVQENMLSQAIEQVTKLEEQLTQLNDIHTRIQGVRNIVDMAMGEGLDSILNGNLTNVIQTFRGAMTGDFAGFASGKSAQMQASITSVLTSAGMSQQSVTAMANSGVAGAERTAAQAASGAVLAATAEQTYAETGVALQRVERLIELSAEATDIKESIDYNTRVIGEVAVLLARNLEMQAIAGAHQGQAGVLSAATIAQERQYMTFSNN